jgi:RNA polymerase sigma-70 factor, ECF subfamily
MNTHGPDLDDRIRRHWRRLAGFLRKSGVPEAEIDDLIQDVWLKVTRHASKWDGQMTWVMTIAANVVRDWRKKKRLLVSDADVVELVDARNRPDVVEADPKLLTCLERLRRSNERFYAAVIAVYYDALTPDEVAAIQGVGATAVRTGLSRARTALRTCIEGGDQ